jgi:hypothetical protein
MNMQIQGPRGGPDVRRRNSLDFIYLKGDADTDGSLRMLPDIVDGSNFEFQLRAGGVWNDTGIQIAASTIFLGRDLEVKGAGDWIHTTDIQEDNLALIPHIEFSDAGGTAQSAHVPILSPLIKDFPIQPVFDTEIVTSHYNVTEINPVELLAKGVTFKTGSVAATENLTVSFLRPAGVVFWTQNYPPSKFPANSDVPINLKGLLEGLENEDIEISIVSTADFSLLGNSLNSAFLLLDFYLLTEEQIMTSTTGMDRVLIDSKDGQTISDESGNLILSGEAP